MQRYFFEIAYNGTNYSGWQKQPTAPTVQDTIENRFYRLFGNQPMPIVGCGRTDSGVHAFQFFFHVDLPNKYSANQLVYKLNNMLPADIAIKAVHIVDPNCHARFDADRRTYRYFIHHKKDPFLQDASWYFPKPLDIDAMNEACELLIGKKDFTSFSKLHTDVKTNICDLYSARWSVKNKSEIVFEVSANRFLRNMVRALVGTLLEVGQGNISQTEFKQVLAAKDRGEAGVSVPAKGLYLYRVCYPFLPIDQK
jgi:tRNA pseudouridine38-40 synthase